MNTEPTIISKIIGFITEGAVKYSFQLIGCVIILIAGWVLSRFMAKVVGRALRGKRVDISVEKFLIQTVRIAVLALGGMFALSSLGVQIAPLIAGLSVAGVGAGLALQGPLSNYASGATLIFTKPFKVGDNIEITGFQGEVKDISLPRTELLAGDGSKVIIPNKHIVGEVIKNYSTFRQLEINVAVSYESDVQKALELIEKIVTADKRIPAAEPYNVGIKEFAESGIKLQAVVCVPQGILLNIKYDFNRAIFDQFKQQGIIIASPRREVYVHQK
jgi:small conductance mechanosensitive channel